MDREPLIELLRRHAEAWPAEQALAARFIGFAKAHADCLLRTCRPGHITASAWIVDASGERALLTHHRKLGRWLQLGGHVDGERHVERAALREAVEESGMATFEFATWTGALVPLDLDVHAIPARGDEPEHLHWDVRFWLRATRGQQLAISEESNDLRWFTPAEVSAVTGEDSVLRMLRKATDLQVRGGGQWSPLAG
ncbi:MAG: NUDIX hydrolase [Planctomycetota bacterium]|jgi:8-oxo-dGTP pyrophosphatase MutT (NUDIX family)